MASFVGSRVARTLAGTLRQPRTDGALTMLETTIEAATAELARDFATELGDDAGAEVLLPSEGLHLAPFAVVDEVQLQRRPGVRDEVVGRLVGMLGRPAALLALAFCGHHAAGIGCGTGWRNHQMGPLQGEGTPT